MGKYVALTARKLRPGTYDDWREAWGSVDGPSGAKAYICRRLDDPDEIIAFGMIEMTQEELEAARPQGEGEERRLAMMAPFVESVGTDGIYEVIDEVEF